MLLSNLFNDKECSREWLVNTDTTSTRSFIGFVDLEKRKIHVFRILRQLQGFNLTDLILFTYFSLVDSMLCQVIFMDFLIMMG